MGVNIQNMPQAAKLGNIKRLGGQSRKTAQLQVPKYLSPTGSIFDAPQVKQTQSTQEPNRNTKTNSKSNVNSSSNIFNSQGNVNFITSGGKQTNNAGKSGFKYSGTNGLTSCLDENVQESINNGSSSGASSDVSVSGINSGNAMSQATSLKSGLSGLKSDVGDIQGTGNQVKSAGARSAKLAGQLDKSDDKFKETFAKQQKELQKLQKEGLTLAEQIQREANEIELLQMQLDNELALDKPDEDRVANYRATIQDKKSVINITGKRINIISRTSKKLTTKMSKTAKTYRKDVKATQTEQKAEQSKTEKLIEKTTKIGLVASIIQSGGMVLGLIADLMISSSVVWLAAVGAAIKPIASTIEAVGGWGKCACDTVNTFAYASEGQIGNALCSCASAIMTGVSAFDASKEAVAGFQNWDSNIAAAKSNALTKSAAKDAGKQAKDEAAQKAKDAGKSRAEIRKAGNDAYNKAYTGTIGDNLQTLNFGVVDEQWEEIKNYAGKIAPSVMTTGQMVANYEQTQQNASNTTSQNSTGLTTYQKSRQRHAQALLKKYGRH